MFLQTSGNKQSRPSGPKPQALPGADTAPRDTQHVLVLRLPTSGLRKERRKRQTSELFSSHFSNDHYWWLNGTEEQSSLPMDKKWLCMAELMAKQHTLNLSLLGHPPYGDTGAPLMPGLTLVYQQNAETVLTWCYVKGNTTRSIYRVSSESKVRFWPHVLPCLNHTGKQLRNVTIFCLKAAYSLEKRKTQSHFFP